jgi:site-specific recombinase XerD
MPFYITSRGYIYLRIYPMPGEVCKFYIGERIDVRHWSRKSQRVLSGCRHADQINKIILKVTDTADVTIRDFKLKGQYLSGDALHAILRQSLYGKPKEIAPAAFTLQQYIPVFISSQRHPATIRAYKSKLGKIAEIFPYIDWHHITPAWRHVALDTLTAKGYSHNYISKLLSVLSTMIRAAVYDGITTVTVPAKLVPTPVKVDTIYLPHDQIIQMYRHHYELDQHTNAVRLWVLLYCTGQRVSDIKRVLNSTQMYIRDVRIVRFEQTKTKKMISLPFNDIMTELWADPPRIISDQKLNKYIKEAASLAGLELADRISSHTARRSCATNLVLNGTPISVVMDITGHTTERECMRYVRYDDISGAIRINDVSQYHALFSTL